MFNYKKTNIFITMQNVIMKANSNYIVTIRNKKIELFILENENLKKVC